MIDALTEDDIELLEDEFQAYQAKSDLPEDDGLEIALKLNKIDKTRKLVAQKI